MSVTKVPYITIKEFNVGDPLGGGRVNSQHGEDQQSEFHCPSELYIIKIIVLNNVYD